MFGKLKAQDSLPTLQIQMSLPRLYESEWAKEESQRSAIPVRHVSNLFKTITNSGKPQISTLGHQATPNFKIIPLSLVA